MLLLLAVKEDVELERSFSLLLSQLLLCATKITTQIDPRKNNILFVIWVGVFGHTSAFFLNHRINENMPRSLKVNQNRDIDFANC